MALFRKKPVTVEAVLWKKHGDSPIVVHLPTPVKKQLEGRKGYDLPLDSYGWVVTLEGGHIATPGDWIITGVKGEHYPCKPDIFKETYDPVDETVMFEDGDGTFKPEKEIVVREVDKTWKNEQPKELRNGK